MSTQPSTSIRLTGILGLANQYFACVDNAKRCVQPPKQEIMFEHIVLRKSELGSPVTAGQIAEALLYYQKVQLIVDRSTLFELVNQLGVDGLETLVQRPELSCVYCEENLGTRTTPVGVNQFHDFIAFSLTGDQNRQFRTPEERMSHELTRQGVEPQKAKKFSIWFLKRVPIRKYSGNHFIPGGITKAAKHDLADADFVQAAFRQALSALDAQASQEAMCVELLDTAQGLCVFSDIDFDTINRRRASAASPLPAVGHAHLLTSLLEARCDLALASFYGGDFSTSSVGSSIIRVRYSELLRRSSLNVEAQRQFEEVLLPDAPRLSEVIDSGERKLDEFFRLLDKGERFKNWLGTTNPDVPLLQAYMRDITSGQWIQSIPSKVVRYAMTSAIGALEPYSGALAGAADTFLIEKLLAGWRPNHFVTKSLTPFVRGY